MPYEWKAIGFVGVITYLLLCLLIPLASKIHLTDIPCRRKQHTGHIPLVGGIAIYLAIILSTFTFIDTSTASPLASIISLAGVITLVGVLDDRYGLPAKFRLLIQILTAVAVASSSHVTLTQLGNLFGEGIVSLGIFAIPISAIAITGLTNAYNMCDGIDGLAASLSLIALTGILITLWSEATSTELLIVSLYISALCVYTPFNLGFKKSSLSKVFMGDAGSMFLGFSIACMLIYFTQKYPTYRPVDALWLVAVPLIDMASTMIRRLLKGQSPLKADKTHLHHILMRLGLSRRQTLFSLIAYGLLLTAAGSLLSKQSELVSLAIFVLIFAVHTNVVLRSFRITKLISRTAKRKRKNRLVQN